MFILKGLFCEHLLVADQDARSSSVGNIGPERLRQLQLCLLGIYKDVRHVCDKYEIPLYLMGGSALGAVRHKGFIPWDDDLDVAMTRRDYRRFCEVFEQELSQKYTLNAPNYCDNARVRFPKVFLKDSRFRSTFDSEDESIQKIFLDIFIIDNIPNNTFVRVVKGCWCDFLEWICGQVYFYRGSDGNMRSYLCENNKPIYCVKMTIGFLFSFLSFHKWNDLIDLAVQCKNEKSTYCGLPTDARHYFGNIMKREAYFPGTLGEFEGESVLLFQDWDQYLKGMYGEYMQLPPEEKRASHGIVELRFPEEK